MNPSDEKKIKWFPVLLNAVVLPGFGQIYIRQKAKGYLLASLALLTVMAAFIRFMSVLFALANVRASTSSGFHPFQLMAEAWRLDHRVLLAFAGGFFAIWLLSILDLILGKPATD